MKLPEPLTIYGLSVFVNDTRSANRTLAKDVPVSPEFRIEVDKWMLEFFGSTPLIPDGTVYHDQINQRVYCNATTYAQIRNMAKEIV